MKKRCAFCGEDFDPDTCATVPVHTPAFDFCSKECEKAHGRAYDRYVDPLDWYSTPGRISANAIHRAVRRGM